MEIAAAADAVKTLKGPLEVVSDSTYVVNCFKNRWWEGWLKKNWTNSQRKPVANRDLWEPFIEDVRNRNDVIFRWVKGHSGDPMNDLVDQLAVEAGLSQQGRTGDSVEAIGAAPKKLKSSQLPDGHLVLITGHKPPALGGYDPNPQAERVKAKLSEIIAAKAQITPGLMVVSGLGLGAEQLGAEAAVEAGVPLVVVLPFPGQEAVWSDRSQLIYNKLLQQAEQEVLLMPTKPSSKQAAGIALGKRDDFLARNVHEAILVWDEQDANVARSFRSLREKLGDDEVWIVGPS